MRGLGLLWPGDPLRYVGFDYRVSSRWLIFGKIYTVQSCMIMWQNVRVRIREVPGFTFDRQLFETPGTQDRR